ncbi:MAG: hypothetical protein FJ404_14405 [Verrucomicrobia bacterium]|nr:hypothetical protein [Verrucomicrobiota bacterium]
MKHDPFDRLIRSASQAAPVSNPAMVPGFERLLLEEYRRGARMEGDLAWRTLTPMLRWVLRTAVAAIVFGVSLAYFEIGQESPYDQVSEPDLVVAFGYLH